MISSLKKHKHEGITLTFDLKLIPEPHIKFSFDVIESENNEKVKNVRYLSHEHDPLPNDQSMSFVSKKTLKQHGHSAFKLELIRTKLIIYRLIEPSYN